MTNLDNNSKVEVLIDAANGYWKEDVIKDTLGKEEVELVCNIPIRLSRKMTS